jgi:hypothetical protein
MPYRGLWKREFDMKRAAVAATEKLVVSEIGRH